MNIRGLRPADIEPILQLWGSNVLDDLEILSYDRWGPGIAVPVSNDIAEARVVTQEPGNGLPHLLRYLIDAPDAFCFVAADEAVVGYLVGAIRRQGVNDFSYGEITEMYVREDRRRRGAGSALVEAAVKRFRADGALQFKVEVPRTWPEGNAFWAARRYWEQDCLVYSLYE